MPLPTSEEIENAIEYYSFSPEGIIHDNLAEHVLDCFSEMYAALLEAQKLVDIPSVNDAIANAEAFS